VSVVHDKNHTKSRATTFNDNTSSCMNLKKLFELISKFPGTMFGGALGQDYIVWHWTFLFSYDDDK
jgi:hypothetical protein